MRKEFAQYIENICTKDDRIVFLTGDIGFMALENIQATLKSKFINVGVAEQNMVGIAAGLAKQGFIPIIYSIAPFIVYRCLEQIRNDLSFHSLPVIIAGNGGGYGYGIMGATHHAIEDYGILSSIGISTFIPMLNSDIPETIEIMINLKKPSYLRMGYGILDSGENIPKFAEWRKLSSGDELTIISVGPVGINACLAYKDCTDKIDHWVLGCSPINTIPQDLINSINKTKKLLFIEEHTQIGGLGQQLVTKLLEFGCNSFEYKGLYACGYKSGKYGSQNFHQKESGLDSNSIYKNIIELIGCKC